MTLDNDFVENGWIYLLWSDPVEFKMDLSRFTVGPDDTIDRASEKRLLDFTIWRGEGRANSHMGGSLAMGADGNLYVATGDNTDPFEQSGSRRSMSGRVVERRRPGNIGQHQRPARKGAAHHSSG